MKNVIILVLLVSGGLVRAADVEKTLVAWVTIADRNVRAGSVLTVQRGDRFDGIVFAERAARKWMAGSNFFRRTQKAQDDYPAETAGGDALLQMAIVYEADRITLYRNGERYASYPAKNIDLLGHDDTFVVFGLRHIGGRGRIAGKIDDARIYDRALTRKEIQSLQPNRESSIKPFAWWDFEGEKIVDRAGRFPRSRMGFGAKLAGGTLDLGRRGVVIAGPTKNLPKVPGMHAGPYVPETPAWPEDPPDNWAIYHLAHPTFTKGSPFDPNPALFYKGRYHLHYIYRNHTGFVFGHVSSTDMVRWQWHPTVLAPPNTGHGMFSGTGFITKDGRAAAVYHGQGSNRNWIVYALDDHLPEQHALMGGLSKRYFAPETLLTPDGRRVVWAWFFGGETKGVQSLPVEMKLPDDGVMRFVPIRELQGLRYDEKKREKIAVTKGEPVVLAEIRGDHLDLMIEISNPGRRSFGVDVLCDENGQHGLRIGVDRAAGLLLAGKERAPFTLKDGEPLTLRIFVDTTLVEVFANDRQYVMTDKPRKAGAKINDRVALTAAGDLAVDSITAWNMKSAFAGDTVFRED